MTKVFHSQIEDLRKKLEDFEKLQELAEKHQNSLSVDTTGYESTIRELRSRYLKLASEFLPNCRLIFVAQFFVVIGILAARKIGPSKKYTCTVKG